MAGAPDATGCHQLRWEGWRIRGRKVRVCPGGEKKQVKEQKERKVQKTKRDTPPRTHIP